MRGSRHHRTGLSPGDTTSTAADLNDSGVVVGNSGTTGDLRWNHGRVTALKTLGAVDGRFYASASAINNRGDIVGFSASPENGREHAVIWRCRP
ncbi:hypothetical protein [Amycolatopsis pigmentata]|uniref:Extracellular repeat, HAF family n=1 Tax=Amycolatopsis pigmentata TaxID=450801 RepID=A0ABW5FZE3_9PSEU